MYGMRIDWDGTLTIKRLQLGKADFRKEGMKIYIKVRQMTQGHNMWGNVHCMIFLMNI